jgi:hypothetical protein
LTGLRRKVLERFLVRLVCAGLLLLSGRFFLRRLYSVLLLRDGHIFRYPRCRFKPAGISPVPVHSRIAGKAGQPLLFTVRTVRKLIVASDAHCRAVVILRSAKYTSFHDD